MKMKNIITIVALSLVLSSNVIAENKETKKSESEILKFDVNKFINSDILEDDKINFETIEENLKLQVKKYNPKDFIKNDTTEIRNLELMTAKESDKEIEKYGKKMITLFKNKNENKKLCKK